MAIASDIENHGDEIIEPEALLADRFGDMVGRSDEMQKLFRILRRIAGSNSTVLIQGENGTGKELIARALHKNSPRVELPFVVQNVAAIPGELIESELFGHRKGAFSGAHRDREGLFEMANHGTFFLDEIGEMTMPLQVKLLRVLQEGTFLPVGDTSFRKVDVRVLCATNRDLRDEVKRGAFREDLFFRINVITVTAPPLRHRREDIPLLADYFIARAALRHDLPRKTLAPAALERLMSHAWPGNVRELENELEKLVILSGEDKVIEDTYIQLSSKSRNSFADMATANLTLPDAVEALERHMILEVLKRTNWNKSQAARDLGVSRRNLIRKVADFGLEEDR
ncbi:MAG: sigma-54 dependent transcriptional regulator [bacterium]